MALLPYDLKVIYSEDLFMDWDDFARPWLDAAADLEVAHRPVLEALMAAAQLKSGESVLDIGCGTGPSLQAASKAVGPGGQIVGIDIAPPLIARAADLALENVELIVGNAGGYPYACGTKFDVVLSNFGIMFFEDTTGAFTHLRRAVRPGGRLAASVWGMPRNNPWFSIPRRIVDDLIPNVPRPDPAGPGPMRFGDPAPLVTALKASGWKPQVETSMLNLTPLGTPEDVAALHMKVTAGMMLRGMDIEDDLRTKVEKRLVEESRKQIRKGAVLVPAEIHIVTAEAA
jgi:SAM-dependent methyltransferase